MNINWRMTIWHQQGNIKDSQPFTPKSRTSRKKTVKIGLNCENEKLKIK